MTTVGIIVHSSSGKDIRRLVASGTVVTNQEKINAITRMLLAMDAGGVRAVEIMPDSTGIGRRAITEVESELDQLEVGILDLSLVTGTADDTLRAARRMHERHFSSVIVMGGDGTCRVASKGLVDTPLIPISTGTNNVFPQQAEGTLVGLAAAAFGTGWVPVQDCVVQAPRLEIRRSGELVDVALVDVVIVDGNDTAARAVWDPSLIRALFLTSPRSTSIGLSAIGGWLHPEQHDGHGLHIRTGPGEFRVVAPIAPGLIREVPIASCEVFAPGSSVELDYDNVVIALDGEREFTPGRGEPLSVHYSRHGPAVLDVDSTLERAAVNGFLRTRQASATEPGHASPEG
ncbi:MAG: ATP-NAD kinase [Actinomycetia bacterium]|nr:ATP-NAD kinase [Actinomycetes bacterium]MCP3913249.1 ATP-NAD kinase [Actinomycetes bacterium]MCP4086607.1 ATP-NAD kinase [Actinomycetes bacterium]